MSSFRILQRHHMWKDELTSHGGEYKTIKCPHCLKQISLQFCAGLDDDDIFMFFKKFKKRSDMKSKIRREPFYQKLGKAILEKRTFTLNDMDGADNIYYPIAKFMLRDQPEQNVYHLINGYAEGVKKNLDHAKRWIEEQGIFVWKKVNDGGKNIVAISIEAEFKEFDLRRVEQALRRSVGEKIISIKTKHPEALPMAQQRLLLESFK